MIKVVGAGSSLQGAEGHVSTRERRDVAEVVGAQRLLLVSAGADEGPVHLLVRLLTGTAVVLIRNPGPVLAAALVDGEALGSTGVELQTHVGDVEGFTCGDHRHAHSQANRQAQEEKNTHTRWRQHILANENVNV